MPLPSNHASLNRIQLKCSVDFVIEYSENLISEQQYPRPYHLITPLLIV